MKLKHKRAIITGGSQGLGEAIARHFLREGASIVICARDGRKLAETRDRLAALATDGQRVLARTCDVSDETEVSALAEFALAELGSVDILVNNAGVYGPMGPTESVDLAEWRRALDINLFGVLLPARALMPHFKKAKAGKIVVISGGGATNPLPNISAYAASKAAVVRLMETLAEELKPFRVDVNAIAPGALATRLVDEVLAARPGKSGSGLLREEQTVEGRGRHAARSRGTAGRLPRRFGERWHHRQTHQRPVGSMGATPVLQGNARPNRHLLSAPNRT